MKPAGSASHTSENKSPTPLATPFPERATGRVTGKPTSTSPKAALTDSHVDTADPTQPPTSNQRLTRSGASESENPFTKIEDFNDEIRDKTKSAYDTIMKVWSNARDSYDKQKRFENLPAERRDASMDQSVKHFKQGRDRPEHESHYDHTFDAAYEAIRSGYRSNTAQLSPMEDMLPMDSSFRASLYPYSGAVRNVSTGLYADLRPNPDGRQGKDFFLCFPGTGAAGNVARQWNDNIDQAKGKKAIPPAYKAALKLATELKAVIEKNGGTLTLVGYSLGGGQANYCGLMLDLPSVCFNAAPLGQGCRKKFEDKLSNAELLSKQVHIRIKHDLVSSEKTHERLLRAQQLTGDLKLYGARHYGQVYVLTPDHPKYPDIPDDQFYKRHNLNELDPVYAGKRSTHSAIKNAAIRQGTNTTKTTAATTASALIDADEASSSAISTQDKSHQQSSSSDSGTDSRVSTATSTSEESDDKSS